MAEVKPKASVVIRVPGETGYDTVIEINGVPVPKVRSIQVGPIDTQNVIAVTIEVLPDDLTVELLEADVMMERTRWTSKK